MWSKTMKKISMEDIARIRVVSDIRLNPSGTKAVYTVITPDRDKNTYSRDLFVLDIETERSFQLTQSGKDSSFLWEDDETLLLISVRSDEDKPAALQEKTAFYRMKITGGEACRAFETACTITDMRRVKQGLYVFKVLKDAHQPAAEEDKDYHILEEFPFWGNGRGYISGKRKALFLYEEETGDLKEITPEKTDTAYFEVRDEQVLYVSKEWDEVIPLTSSISVYDISAEETEIILEGDRESIVTAVFADEGILYAGTDMKEWGSSQLADLKMIRDKKSITLCTTEGASMFDNPMTDCARNSGRTGIFKDGIFRFTAMKGCRTAVYALRENEIISDIVLENGTVFCFDIAGDTAVFIGAEKDRTPDVYVVKNGENRKVTAVNEDFFRDTAVSETEYIPFEDRDGIQIDAWALKPSGYEEGGSYPSVLAVHGGPRAAYGDLFYHELQMFAAEGYFVIFCNPRGSEGYGEAFADIRGRYGTIDYTDIMDLADHALRTYPAIDPDRMCMEGGSYGGFMANWIEGHTDRFAAICSQRSIADWISDFGSSEIGMTFDGNEMDAVPWSDPKKMWDQSPLQYACNAKTPILFIHSTEDHNCPLTQGMEMFSAMKYFHVPSRMVIFEGENHNLCRSGKPKHRIRRLREMLEWFDRYTKNDPQRGS